MIYFYKISLTFYSIHMHLKKYIYIYIYLLILNTKNEPKKKNSIYNLYKINHLWGTLAKNLKIFVKQNIDEYSCRFILNRKW